MNFGPPLPDLEQTTARRLGALSHPARLRILAHLAGCENCCCKDVVEHLDLAQSTVSQHLKVLVEAGLVTYSADRQRSRYTLDRAALDIMRADLDALLAGCCRTDPAHSNPQRT